MGRILDKFIQQLPKLQADSIQKELLHSKANREIRSVQAFREAFQEKLRALLDSDEALRYEMRELLVDQTRSSELINSMISLITDDLFAMFAESDMLLSLADTQSVIFRDEIINRLRQAVSEASSELDRVELLTGNTIGFTNALVEKFRDSNSRLPRTDPVAELVYKDPKLNTVFSPDYDMAIEATTDGLVLPIKSQDTLVFSAIRDQQSSDVRDLSERFSIPREIEPSSQSIGPLSVEGNINNIIDRKKGTFWIKKIQTARILPDGAKLNLLLSIGPPKEINFVEIQPFGPNPLELTGLYYQGEDSIFREIELPAVLMLKEQTRVFFNPVFASKILVLFTQRTPASSIKRANDKFVSEYVFGLDNILAGQLDYLNRGYYVTKTLTAEQISTIQLITKENLRVNAFGSQDVELSSNLLPTIEYWIHFREYDPNGSLVFSKFLPIAPIGTETIRERFDLRVDSTASLNFMVDPHLDDEDHDPDDLLVYRGRVLINRPLDYNLSQRLLEAEAAEVKETELVIPGAFNEQRELIASYKPLHVKAIAPVKFTDATGLIRYNMDNSINIERPSSSRATESQVNLLIIMRGSENQTHTAVIDEVTLCIG
jgi:hypothetical protein